MEYFDTSAGNNGQAYRNQDVDIEVTGDVGGGFNVGWIDEGEYLTYDLNLPVSGKYDIVLRVATPQDDVKSINVVLGGKTYTASFTNTGGWQTYTDVKIAGAELSAGNQILRLDMLSKLFNLNYIDFIPQQLVVDETAPSAKLDTTSILQLPGTDNTAKFTVTFTDNVAVDLATIDANDLQVTASNGTILPVTLVSIDRNGNDSLISATYAIAAPGGTWDVTDQGNYTVALQSAQVSDTSGNFSAAANLGSFQLNVFETQPPTAIKKIRIEAEDYKTGTNGVEYFDTSAGNNGQAYRNQDVDIEVTGDVGGGFNVGWIDEGEYLTYDLNLPVSGKYDIVLRVATPQDDVKSINVVLGGKTYTASFTNTGGWQTYTDVKIAGAELSAGNQILRLDMLSKLFNLNYIDFIPQQLVVDETAPSAKLDTTSILQLPGTDNTAKFTVTFTDNVAVDLATIDANDLQVTASNGTILPVTLVSIDRNGNDSLISATYAIAAPGGTWDVTDQGNYTVALQSAQVSDTSGNFSAAANLGSFQLGVSAPTSDGVIRINSGSNQDAVDSLGQLWQADTYFLGGQAVGPVANSIANTVDDFIYQSQRTGNNFSYAIPVANNNYKVNLYLAELNFSDVGKRLFDVSFEEDLAFDNLDIFQTTKNAFNLGDNTAKVIELPSFAFVRDGVIDLNFESVLKDATLAGIEIIPIEGAQVLIKESGNSTLVFENGNTDNYQVVLNTQPTSDVTINFQLDDQVSVEQNSLVFTVNNWNIPQTVTVKAVNDNLAEGFHGSIIKHTISTTDSAYSNLIIPSVSVSIVDNDLVDIKFDKKVVANTPFPTVGAWGHDGRLYVGSYSGVIKVYTFDDNYNVIDEQSITTIAGLSNNNITGIAFNPFENDYVGQPRIYVSHNQFYANNGGGFDILTEFSPYSGQVSVLEGPGFSQINPLITNIGVSNHDHGVNGLLFDHKGDLLITVGSNTNAGIANNALGGIDESPFTAAILKAEITKPNFNGNIQYQLPNNWIAPEGLALLNPEKSQGFGGIVDVVDGVDVSVYASGFRNSFDLVYTTKGIIYATENGANQGFGDVSTSATTQEPFTLNIPDELNIVQEGSYYGSPNRNRGRVDDRQNTYYSPSESSNEYYTAPIAEFAASTNGIIEYRSTTFSSQLRGNLLAQQFNSTLYNIKLSEDGTKVLNISSLETEAGNGIFVADGLDVLTGPGGAIISIDPYENSIKVATPVDNLLTAMTAYDISSWRAPASGGGQFIIGGVNFSPLTDTTVTIGNELAIVTSVSERWISGIFPSFNPSGDDLLDIVVGNNGQISTITDAFQPLFF